MLGSWVNGSPGNTVAIEDRGLQYGDGLFETMHAKTGRIRLLDLHLDRLFRGCDALEMPRPDSGRLRAELDAAAAVPGAGIVKLILTRGAGARGYRADPDARPTRIVAVYEPPTWPADRSGEGVTVRLCVTRLTATTVLAGLKTLNRLEQVVARSEWSGPEPEEGLLLDTTGRVVCATQANLFIVAGGRLLTPRIDRCGIAGVMRAAVLAQAPRMPVDATQVDLTLAEVMAADEVFLTNALIGAWPVRRLLDRAFRPGPVTRAVQEWISAL